jgi:Kef-type K+ transport system membrane component KefB
MIQRIQTVWLLLAALVMGIIFYFPLYKFSDTNTLPITIGENFLAIVLVILSIVLSLVTLVNFKKRKRQIGFAWLNILLCAGLQAWLLFSVNNATNKPEFAKITGHYWMGLFVPLIVIILLFLAKAGIRKDEKLIKSLDRLR